MNPKVIFRWFYDQGKSYNLFMLEVDDYDDDEVRDSATVHRRQKYATWLYVILLMVSLYILFYITLTRSHTQTVTIDQITPLMFKQLSLRHAQTLSCPCANITVPHRSFVFHTIAFHPVCSSVFVSEQWIEGLYLINASEYGPSDFRATARSQFQLLADLCSISQNTVTQNRIEFDNDEFLTIDLLPEERIRAELNATINRIKNSLSTQIISFLNYIRVYVRGNYLVSALNTNLIFGTYFDGIQYDVYQLQTQYTPDTTIFSRTAETMLCGTANPATPATFFSKTGAQGIFTFGVWSKPPANSTLVNGFFAACTALEALLLSTLDCLYDVQCVHLLTHYFPALNRLNFTWTNSVLSSRQQNISLYGYLLNLFVEEWLTEVNYSKYFAQCAPSSCSYTTSYQRNFSYALTVFISLYSGLVMLLRLISPTVVKIFWKVKHRSTASQNARISKLVQSIKQLNLYKDINKRSEQSLQQQRLMTRVYLLLLTGSITILLIFTSVSTEIVTMSEPNPSMSTYNKLQVWHTNMVRCPCSTTTVPYQTFITLSPTLHQVCSSDFITDRWLSIIQNIIDFNAEDWRNRAYLQFTLLSNLCQLAKNTIDDAVHRFLSQPLIVSSVLSELELNRQLDATLNEFFQSTSQSFRSLIDIARLLTQVDQPYMGIKKTNWDAIVDKYLTWIISIDNNTREQSLQVVFSLPGTRYVNLSSTNCICATNQYCQSPVAIYQMDNIWNSRIYAYINYIVPGSFASCSPFNSLMLSQLLCLYSEVDCYSILMNYMKASYYQNVENPSWFDVRPLVYNSQLSRYPPNSSISMIVEQLMIETWNPSYSYHRFYELCAPNYCTYAQRVRSRSVFEAIVTFVAMIGGLSFALRLLTPPLVKVVGKLLTLIIRGRRRSQHEQQQSVRLTACNRLKMFVTNNIVSLGEAVINLNIFSRRDFGSNIDWATVKYLGKWATRLYIVLFAVGLTILTLHTIIQSQTRTETFDKPSFHFYKQLKQKYEDKLKCSCSVIASKYNQFVQVEAAFHQICASPYTSIAWRTSIADGLTANLSGYGQRDYRRFLSAHLQYLQGSCDLSIRSINDSIEQLLSSLFTTTDLLSEDAFRARLDSSIEQKKFVASKTFTHLFFLIRSINHGNAIVSTYGTNFEYRSSWFSTDVYAPYIPSRAIIYDNNCSCGLHSNCTTPANFIHENSSAVSPIQGLKMGCTPSESLRSSTLECFYDQSCINLIQQYTNSLNYSIPLSTGKSRYLMNTTVADLIDNLFVEQWVTTVNYSSYFERCLPLLCSYTYNQQFNALHTVTLLIGLQGGLTIVLSWICPKIVRIIARAHATLKKRSNNVEPTSSGTTTAVEISHIDVDRSVSNLETVVANALTERKSGSSSRCCFRVTFACLMLLIVIMIVVLFSIYFPRLEKSDDVPTRPSSTITTSFALWTTGNSTLTTSTTATTHVPACQLKFQATLRYRTGSTAGLKSPVVGDFNGDNRLDVAFFNYYTHSIHVLIGDGRGNYTIELRTLVQPFTPWYFSIAAADFNEDKQLDLAFTTENRPYIYMVFGNGNGTFRSLQTFFMGNNTNLRGIMAFDFNGDNHTDIAVSAPSFNIIIVLLGTGQGSFSNRTTYYAGRNANPSSVDLADFNGDGHQDISYNNIMTRSVGVLLGRGDGTFEEQKTSFVGGYYYPSFIAIGDFNSDHRPDVVISYSGGKRVGVLLGYGNGTMGSVEKFAAGNKTSYPRIAVGDFNNDGHSDIAVNSVSRSVVYILVGYGDGNFEVQMIFSTGFGGTYSWMVVADFNNDGCQDLLASDDINGAVFILLNTCECQATGQL